MSDNVKPFDPARPRTKKKKVDEAPPAPEYFRFECECDEESYWPHFNVLCTVGTQDITLVCTRCAQEYGYRATALEAPEEAPASDQ